MRSHLILFDSLIFQHGCILYCSLLLLLLFLFFYFTFLFDFFISWSLAGTGTKLFTEALTVELGSKCRLCFTIGEM